MNLTDCSIVYFRHNFMTGFFEMPTKKNKFYDVTFLIKGKMKYVINGVDVELNSKDIILIPPGSTVYREASEAKTDFMSINFASALFSTDIQLHLKSAITPIILHVLSVYEEIHRTATDDIHEKCKHLLNVLMMLIENIQKSYTKSSSVAKIKQYIKDNLSKKITLQDIGTYMFFSPVYCESIFKKEVGTSIIDYVIDERISEAKRLMDENILSLSQISDEVGFNDYNYFSRIFKKRTGYSPKKYKSR